MICGIDEAGRGTLCGSLFVAGVVCTSQTASFLKKNGIKDSKKTTKTMRQKLIKFILQAPNLHYHIVKKDSIQIDNKGLSLCLKESLQEIILHLSKYTSHFIIDGNSSFKLQVAPHLKINTLIKGDQIITQISAASILAKYAKDQEMQEYHQRYPLYNFIKHSGYGTKEHLEKIKTLGFIKEHRKSFLIKSLQSHPTSLN